MKTLSKLVSMTVIALVFAGGCLADASSEPTPDEAAGDQIADTDLAANPTGTNTRPDLIGVAKLPADVCSALRDNWLNCTDNCDSAWSVYNRYCR